MIPSRPLGKPVRRIVRDAVALALHAAGITGLHRGSKERLTIVTFHRVLPEHQLREYPIRSIAVTPAELAWFLETLAKSFQPTTLADAAGRWLQRAEGKPPLAITFDDGQLDNYLHARPVLEQAGVKATFFVASAAAATGELLWHDRMAYVARRLLAAPGSEAKALWRQVTPPAPDAPGPLEGDAALALAASAVEAAKRWSSAERQDWMARAEGLVGSGVPAWDGMMTSKELRALAAAGHEIGCHSHSHEILPVLEDAALRREILDAGQRVTELSGQRCTSFCYPNGDHDRRCLELVRSHYDWGVTVQAGYNRRGDDVAALRRFDMVADNTRTFLGNLSQPLLAWRMRSFGRGSGA